MRTVFLLSVLLLCAVNVHACMNLTVTSSRGTLTQYDLGTYIPNRHTHEDNVDHYQSELEKYDKLWRLHHKVDDYSDYGVYLVYLGRYAEAKDVFLEIEEISPGRYATAANLGTVYELLGENENALRLIKKAVEIDPNSHDASEWIHVKILEAKIGGDSLVTSAFLLNTTFGDGELPETSLSDEALEKLRDALFYQLKERVPLVKAPDKIVALLLFELGNIVSITDEVYSAMSIYLMAKEYGYQSAILDKRTAKFEVMQAEVDAKYNKEEEDYPLVRWLKYGLVFALVIAAIIIAVRLVGGKKNKP